VWEKQLTLPYELVKTSCRLRQCKGKNKYRTNKRINLFRDFVFDVMVWYSKFYSNINNDSIFIGLSTNNAYNR